MDSKVILFIAALIVAVVYLWVDNNRRRRERIEKKLESSWGKPSTRKITDDEMKVISHYYEDSIENSGADSGYIDDTTWNDLDMDRIYKKMNIANCSNYYPHFFVLNNRKFIKSPRFWQSLSCIPLAFSNFKKWIKYFRI